MKKSYQVFASLFRWMVAGVILSIIALPALVSFTLDA
jgi:hypothetical protein